MRIDVLNTAGMSFGEACEYVAGLCVPAVLCDGEGIVRRKSRRSETIPAVRVGARITRYITGESAKAVGDSPEGIFVPGKARGGLPDFVAVRGGDYSVFLFGSLSMRLADLARESASGFAGYDCAVPVDIVAAGYNCALLCDERAYERLLKTVDLLFGSFSVRENDGFNAASLLRSVLSAAEPLLRPRRASANGSLPARLYSFGSEKSMAAILAASVCVCALLSANGRCGVSVSVDGGSAEIRFDCETAVNADALERVCSPTPLSFSARYGALALDVYFARILAENNGWSFAASKSENENGKTFFGATLSFESSGAPSASEFVFCDSENQIACAIVEALLSSRF